jgi:hypothetical protein
MHPDNWRLTGSTRRVSFAPSQFAVALSLILLLVALPAVAKGKLQADDSDYALALGAANRFLHAWQNNDVETGVLLLTDGARKHTSESGLRQLLAGSSNPRGFEIARGRRLRPGRYAFPVVLVERSLDGRASRQRSCEIVIVRAGKDDWAVDKLP